jgi:phage regulator Rha-like protein
MATKIIPSEVIQSKIFFLRGCKVMLDKDLGELYGVETKQLKRAVKRNLVRFPSDFMFELSPKELHALRYHFGTLKRGTHPKYLPYAFTEHGILMLSSVLNSKRAILVNIEIMRTFAKLRMMLASHAELRAQVEKMEKKYDYQFKVVFDAIKELLGPPAKPKNPMGFHAR